MERLHFNVAFLSKEANEMLKFLVFADLHYKKGMYAVKISDMEKILERANENQVNFMIHA